MAKKITIVTGIFPPDLGGPAKFAHDFGTWLTFRGTHVSVISYSNIDHNDLNLSGVNVNLIPRSSSLLIRHARFIRMILHYKKLGHEFFAVGAFVEIYLAKILFGVNYTAKVPGDIVWERARNKQRTRLGISEFQNSTLGVKYRMFRWLYSSSLRSARKVIVPSKGLFDLCESWGVQKEKLNLVYNSIDVQQFASSAKRLPQYDVLTVCRLTPWKGVSDLIRICSDLKITLLVVGEGPERSHLESLAESLGCESVFLGNVPIEKMPDVYQSARVFVLNSEYEGLPHSLIEARAAGCLTIARAGTGSAEVIRHGIDGFLVDSQIELKTLLARFAKADWEIAKFIEMACVDTSKRFNRNNNFPAILSVLEI
jgi:glycosyltransferase involved in cell wall biosynthesis